jgi:hypothetical protein
MSSVHTGVFLALITDRVGRDSRASPWPADNKRENISAAGDRCSAALYSEWARFFMTRLKRFVPLGVVFSAVGHGSLLVALLIIGTGGVRSVPPPEPIAVEIVRSDEVPQTEMPHVEGTPLDSTSNGSEISSDSKNGSANTAAARRQNLAAPPQH